MPVKPQKKSKAGQSIRRGTSAKRASFANPNSIIAQERRLRVLDLASKQVPHKQIAALVGVSQPMLYKHFRHELDTGAAASSEAVANVAFNMATSGRHPQITWKWAEVHMDWTSKQEVEVSGSVNLFINTGIKRPGDGDVIELDGQGNVVDHDQKVAIEAEEIRDITPPMKIEKNPFEDVLDIVEEAAKSK